MLDARHVRLVMALCEHGSFVRAGRVLGMSPSALTRALSALEDRLRARLFERSRRALEPTAVCRAILAKGAEVLRATDELSAIVSELRGEQRDTLVVATGPFALNAVIAGASAQFLAREQRVQLRIEIGSAVVAVRQVLERKAALAVAELSDIDTPQELEIVPLRQHPLFLVVRPGHPLLGIERPLTAGDALRFPAIVPPYMPPRFAQHVAAGLQNAAADRTHQAFPAVVTESVGAGLAIAMQSDAILACTAPCAAVHLRAGALRALPWRPAWMAANFGVVHLRGRRLSPAARLLMACIAEADAASFALARSLLPAGTAMPDEAWALTGTHSAPAMVKAATAGTGAGTTDSGHAGHGKQGLVS